MKIILAFIMICIFVSGYSKDISIVSFGAKADGRTINTKYIQAAIDQCSAKNDRLVIPSGVFMTGTLYMRNGTSIYFMDGAVLMGSPTFKDYPENPVRNTTSHKRALLYGYQVNHLSITGRGMVNGNGLSQEFQLGDDSGPKGNQGRPEIILFIECKNIKVEGISLKNSAFWMQNYVACENIYLKGLNIYNHANFNNDAIDIDSKNVLIEDCVIDSDDDGLCLKSNDKNRPCENVTIRNCLVASNCNAVKFGTTSRGGFRNISITNISIKHAAEDRIRKWQEHQPFIGLPTTVISGIAIENVDGGSSDNITISNINMEDVQTPIFIKLGNRLAARLKPGMPTPSPGHLRNLSISNINAISHSKIASSITGFPGYDIENIQLNNIIVSSMGKGTAEEADIILPENETLYPENRMFGFVHPESGMLIRHVKGLLMQNVQMSTRNKDNRINVLMEDVKEAGISQLNNTDSIAYNAVLKMINCRDITVAAPLEKGMSMPVLQVQGGKTRGIYITGAGQRSKSSIINLSADVAEKVVTIY